MTNKKSKKTPEHAENHIAGFEQVIQENKLLAGDQKIYFSTNNSGTHKTKVTSETPAFGDLLNQASSHGLQTRVEDSNKQRERITDRQNWYKKVPHGKREEWLIDCYRMRNDDLYCWLDPMELNGIYFCCANELSRRTDGNYTDPVSGHYSTLFGKSTDSGFRDLPRDSYNTMKLGLVIDFIKFVKLAVRNQTLPESITKKNKYFSFEKMLTNLAPELLPKIFKKKDAIEKYGGENVFGDKPSLRRQAEFIYLYSCQAQYNQGADKEACFAALKKLKSELEESIDEEDFDMSEEDFFEDIGGLELWNKFYNKMKLNGKVMDVALNRFTNEGRSNPQANINLLQ